MRPSRRLPKKLRERAHACLEKFFQTNRFPKTEAFFQRVLKETDAVVDAGKGFWTRPRPYLVDTNLLDGEMEKFSGSYRNRIVAL